MREIKECEAHAESCCLMWRVGGVGGSHCFSPDYGDSMMFFVLCRSVRQWQTGRQLADRKNACKMKPSSTSAAAVRRKNLIMKKSLCTVHNHRYLHRETSVFCFHHFDPNIRAFQSSVWDFRVSCEDCDVRLALLIIPKFPQSQTQQISQLNINSLLIKWMKMLGYVLIFW